MESLNRAGDTDIPFTLLKTRKKKKKRERKRDCVGVSSVFYERHQGILYISLFINEIKLQIKKKKKNTGLFSRGFNPGIDYRRRAEGGDFPAYVSRRVVGKGWDRREEDENLRAAVYYRDEGVV